MKPKLFSFPAEYRKYVESQLGLVGAEILRDINLRANPNYCPGVLSRRCAIADHYIDRTATGRVAVAVGDPDSLSAATDVYERPQGAVPV